MTAGRETPPRAWGRPPEQREAMDAYRNTPTCVGKTFTGVGFKLAGKKHPHVRGEDPAGPPAGRASLETPPRAWGRP